MSSQYKTVAFYTLGCKLNFSETSTISKDFSNVGFKQVSYKEMADIYVLNTCSVTENADKEARKLIRQAKKRNPSSIIAVMGCYAQLKPKEISQIEGVDIVLGANQKFKLIDYLDGLMLNTNKKVHSSNIKQVNDFIPSYSLGERTRSYLKVQDGCNYTCSFCTIPLARGKSRSNSIEETIRVAKELSKKNIREIVLTGINIGDFGTNGHETFYDLIKKLDQLNYIDRLRISSIEPNLLSDEIIEFCAESKKFMPHFHIPLQSGSNKILSLMKRRYNKELYKSKINKVRNVLPNCSIGVDVMVGFPGESDQEFLKTYRFLNNLDISYLHVFTYSERNNTRALNYKDVVSKKERANRSKMLRILSLKKKRSFYNKFVNTTRPVLFESIKNNRVIGHTDNYLKVEVDGNKNIINTIKTVKLTKMKDQTLIGELV